MNQIIKIPKVAALPDVIPCHLISYIVAEFLPNMPKVIANPSAFEPPHIILPTATHHTHTVIALHDRGSNGLEFSEELFEGTSSSGLNLQGRFPSWKWVFPSSQERYSTVFQERMDKWFDIYSLTDPAKREDLQVEGVRDSIDFLRKVVEDEAKHVTHRQLILLGISQGSATGLLTLLAGEFKLGAYVGLSGWMPFRARIEEAIKDSPDSEIQQRLASFFQSTVSLEPYAPSAVPSALATPIFLGHAADDEVVDIELGLQALTTLKKVGAEVSWKECRDGGHLGFLEIEGLDDMIAFLAKEVGDGK